jgi:hypothetical protein
MCCDLLLREHFPSLLRHPSSPESIRKQPGSASFRGVMAESVSLDAVEA